LIGVLGGGQLGRMLALAGVPLGHDFTFVDPAPDACAAVLGRHLKADFDDPEALLELARTCEVVTFEFERVPTRAATRVGLSTLIRPGPRALEAGQDRLGEKELFESLGMEVTDYAAASAPTDLVDAIARTGLPAVVKTRTEGYDGKGQSVLRSQSDVARAEEGLAGWPLIVEAQVDFDRELSIIAARSVDGDVVCYPLIENHHHDGILRLSLAPAPNVQASVQSTAESHARSLLEHLDYVGVVAIELFQVGDRLLANEFAPRVHNSGHWTIEGAATSQFENHVRAITSVTLGPATPTAYSAMVNLIGVAPSPADALRIEGAHLHLYGKTPREGRKVGHLTLIDDSSEHLRTCLERVVGLPGTKLPEV
jgi:5-(carboxyamino)imidazole ribonucleotide synthase